METAVTNYQVNDCEFIKVTGPSLYADAIQGAFPGTIDGLFGTGNVFTNTRFEDADHVGSSVQPEIFARFVDHFNLLRNDYTASGAPGIEAAGVSGGTTILLFCSNSVVHDVGGYPVGLGNRQWVTDILGTNNIVMPGVGSDADPGAIGDAMSAYAKNKKQEHDDNMNAAIALKDYK